MTRRYRASVTDFMTLRGVIGNHDPALPRIGTDLMTLRGMRRNHDPTLPRDGTDFITQLDNPSI
jgi:hypothetical protein